MAARIEKGQVKLLTRSGLDWTAKYPAMATAFAQLKVNTAYIDGELCGVRADGVTSFEIMQQVSRAAAVTSLILLSTCLSSMARILRSCR